MFLTVFLLLQATPIAVTGQNAAGKDLHLSETTTSPLTNQDVLALAKAKFTPEVIVAKIKTSTCAFGYG